MWNGFGSAAKGDVNSPVPTSVSGQGAHHNTLPPYRAVYIQLRAKADPVVAQEVAADRLATARKIGSADFDGSEDVTLAQVGAEPAFAKNDAFNKSFGTAAGTVCQGNDSRLSNARRASNITMGYDGNLYITYS